MLRINSAYYLGILMRVQVVPVGVGRGGSGKVGVVGFRGQRWGMVGVGQ